MCVVFLVRIHKIFPSSFVLTSASNLIASPDDAYANCESLDLCWPGNYDYRMQSSKHRTYGRHLTPSYEPSGEVEKLFSGNRITVRSFPSY